MAVASPTIAFPRQTRPYRRVVLFVGGFMQRRTMCNGIRLQEDEARRAYTSPRTKIEYLPWLVDPVEIAEELFRLAAETEREEHERLKIVIVGYSFGGGTAANIARAFYRIAPISFEIDELVLIDPVRRLGQRLGWIGAMLPLTIDVPRVVKRVRWINQANPNWRLTPPFFFPSSHHVAVDRRYTELAEPLTLDCEHSEIDYATRVRAEVSDAIESTMPPTTRTAA